MGPANTATHGSEASGCACSSLEHEDASSGGEAAEADVPPRWRSGRGQVTVELMGMAGLIFFTVMTLWQAALIGYTMLLASRAADQSAREAATQIGIATIPGPEYLGEQAGEDSLPSTWQDDANIEVTVQGYRARSHVSSQVPLVVPGWASFPFTVTASSEARA